MVFEKALSAILNKFLGDFVENLDGNQLNVGIWGGDVELKNLVLKPSALDDLDLPLQTVYGKIGKLVLKIPWKSVYTSPTIICLEDIFLLAEPNQQVEYDSVKEDKRSTEGKKKELQKVEDAKKAEAEKDKPKADSTFVERLITNIIKNVQLNIKNIHIRYEDRVTHPSAPFALGVTLCNLTVESTDSHWQKAITEDISKIYKIVQLESLAVYWNCNCAIYKKLPQVDMINKMLLGIASKIDKPTNYTYVLGPINSSARLRINQKPENDSPQFSIPKIHVNLDMEKLFIGISKAQYRDIIALADSMDRMLKGAPYRKYRPHVDGYRGHYKEWWWFAYRCVLEGDIRRRKRNWDWNHILMYRNTCKEYKELYNKSMSKSLKPEETSRIEQCEKILDLTNIVIIRQQAQLETERLAKSKDTKETKSWFGWMWKGSTKAGLDDADKKAVILKQFESEMTPDEKAKLYRAIDYQENAAPAIYPVNFVDNSSTFLLRALEIELRDDEAEVKTILLTDLRGVKCKVETRPAASAIAVHVKIDDFTTVGMMQEDFIPKIITSETLDKTKGLLEVAFETNPLDGSCDQRIHVTAYPLKIVFDALTIKKIIEIFKIPSDTSLDQIQAAAGDKLTDVKELTATGLQHAIEKHVRLDLNINLMAPYIIIPYGGKFTGEENVLVVNLGRLKIYTSGKPSSPATVKKLYDEGRDKKDIFRLMAMHSYDNFKLELADLQILVAQSDEDWKVCINDSAITQMHLLNPLTLSITYSKCLITDDPRLPLSKISGKLPSIDVNISEARLLLLATLVTSIPLPVEEAPEPQLIMKKSSSSTQMLKYIGETKKHLGKDLLLPRDTAKEELIQFIILSADFVMSELSLTISQQETIDSQMIPLVQFKVKLLECQLEQQTFVTKVTLQLGSIGLMQNYDDRMINIISTPASDDYLFKVQFSQVDVKSPDLHTLYKSCETCLELDFATLNVILHQEGLLALIRFSTDLQNQITSITADKKGDGFVSTMTRQLSVISEDAFNETQLILKKPARRKIPVLVETIKFKLKADLKEFTVKFSTNQSDISSCAIGGIYSVVIIKDTYTQINAKLCDISVTDLNPHTRHHMILSGIEGTALTTQVVLNNLEEESEKPDMDITIKVGGMRIIFLNWFVSNMLNFLNQFQTAQQKIIDASHAAAQTAKENMKQVYTKATKMSLDINIRAPSILVPVNSQSYDGLLLDLGIISMSNNFLTLDIKNKEGFSAVVDDLKVDLTNLKISRVRMDDKYSLEFECVLFEPLNLHINVNRNLATAWYTSIPDLDVSGKIKTIQVMLGQTDYHKIMDILNGNLSEGQQPGQVSKGTDVSKTSQVTGEITTATVESRKETTNKSEVQPTVHVFLKFTFTMEELILNLYSGKSESISHEFLDHDPKNHLARFSLEGLSLKGRILTDQSIVTSILLVNCVLDDMRPGREDKLNRLIERSQIDVDQSSTVSTSSESVAPPKSMIDITFQQKQNDMFADVRVCSMTFILSVDYLKQVAEFFGNPNQSEQENKQTQTTKSVASVSKSKTKTAIASEQPQKENQMTLNLKLEKPDIVLVEHMDNINTKAMILNSEILVKLRMAGAHQVINGVVKDLQLYTCNYNPVHRAGTRCNILHPVTISLAGSTPQDKGLHVELLVTEMLLSVSPATIELVNRVLVTMTASATTEKEKPEEQFNYLDLWQPKAFTDQDYWYLKTDEGVEAVDYVHVEEGSGEGKQITKIPLQELCIMSIPSITVTVEAGVGNKTLPMLLLKTSFKGSARNWSSQLSIEASLTVEMGYYNSRLALWEPLIEPVETEREKRSVFVPWELKLEVTMNDQDDNLTLSPVSELDADTPMPQPVMSIDVISENNLELTVTKTLLDVLQNLGKAFASALKSEKIKSASTEYAPYKVLNEIGEDVTLLLEQSSFKIAEGGSLEDINKSAGVPLQLKVDLSLSKNLNLNKELIGASNQQIDQFLRIKINDKNCELNLPVTRADKRFFLLNYRRDGSDNWGIISDINVDEGVTVITLRSILQVYNHFNVSIDVYYMTPKGNELELIGPVQPGSFLNVPLKAVYNPTNELFFAVSGYAVTSTPYIWRDLKTNLTITKILHCPQKDLGKGRERFVIKAVGEMEQVYYENTSRHTMASACYNIHLRPTVILKNYLPLDIVCCVDELAEEFEVKPGDTLQLPNVHPGKNVLVIRIPDYLEKEWSYRQDIFAEPPEFCVWTFNSYDSPTKMSLDLGMHTLNKHGSLIMSLYCPFWMLNKTGLMLGYRNSDEHLNILHHPAHFKQPILFSFNAKNFFGKKKASLRIETGDWSDKFSLDVAGSSGVVTCKANNQIYQIGVHNQLTYNGLTKQVTFTPYYVIINNAPFPIECQENGRPADPWIPVEPKSCSSLWPKSELEDKLLKVRVANTDEISAPFLYTESHNTLLKLNNKYGGINVDVQVTEGAVYINFAPYETGTAPALLVNHTRFPITYWEKESVQKRNLEPKHYVLYTWENPSGPRVLAWDRGYKKEILNDLCQDSSGEFSPSDDVNICWASFLDGMQRILLFTENRDIIKGAQILYLLEVIQQEITVSIHGLGLSLVNNDRRQEIMYLGIASSGVIWETCKMNAKRYKPLGNKDSTHLENVFQQHLLQISTALEDHSERTIIDGKMEVDFKAGLMLKPHKRKLRRTFQTGLWFQMKNSPSQMQVHARINRLQIDNQMFDCIFPVVLAPIPPPKSVAADSGIKPFLELSIVQLLMKNSQIRQFKYFKVLVQEFHIKVDLGFINAIVDLLQQAERTDEEEKQYFLTDVKLVDEKLYSLVSSKSIQEQKSFYDLLHFSPLKIHISFSMAAGTSAGQQATAPNFLNVLLQGIGVTLTDLQDVVFKLAYFERNFMFLTQRQLTNEVTSHYAGQAIKQLYVLVLGLDVIGNPYGLVLGITKGVEDLFYEPFQGAIQGPGEFAEGLALGVKSLFGHTVGGAAGAMSRITGAMGKGLAALTFDDEFQRKRRDQLNKKPATAHEGIARSGKGLVMGVYSGVTGVFTKPVTGAKEEGVEGFFKGLGKGAVGLVTRPVAGVVDFASGSLDVVKRAAECNEETTRLRSPRFVQADGLIRPYNKQEAEGNRLLNELSKGKYAKTDVYAAYYVVIEKKEILLLTDKRMAYICHNDIFGGWQIEWSYTWEELPQPVKIVPKGILVTTSEKKKKIFGSSDTTKTIIIADAAIKEDICVKIESLRGAYV